MTDKPTLYSLTDEMNALYSALMDEMGEDGELPPDSPTVEALAQSEQAWMVKARNVAFVAKRLQHEANKMGALYKVEKAHADTFKRKADALENAGKRLKQYLHEQMLTADKRKVNVEPFDLAICKSPPSLDITDDTKIPVSFKTISTDEARVKEALKQGQDVPGARLITGNTHLRIR